MTRDRSVAVPDTEAKQRHLLDRRLAQARRILVHERLWPVVVVCLSLGAAFLALSWVGLWIALPPLLRLLGVLSFAAAAGMVMVRALRRGLPTRSDALARLDRDSGEPHRPISSREDSLADPGADATTRALWSAHRRRLDAALARVRLAAPSPRMVDRDRYALRAAALMCAVAAAFVAGPDREGRIAAAFEWRGSATPGAGFRLDSWIDPPPYTGRPPVLLSGTGGPVAGPSASPPEVAPAAGGSPGIAAPVKSALVIRSSGEGRVEVATAGGIAPVEAAPPTPGSATKTAVAPGSATGASPAAPANAERRFMLSGDARVTVTRDGETVARYDIHAIPDRPPTISLDGAPVRNARGSLTLRYTVADDYGVVAAEATFSDPLVGGRPVRGRTLADPPRIALSLPAAPRGLGRGETTADIADSPWAGATVTLVLTAHDEGGNTGSSAPTSVVLPARAFTKPLARALVEQRRNLVLDPDHRDRIGTALDALTLAPDLFDETPAVYLGLRTAKTRLDAATADADLLGVADLLWSMALQIEDGDQSQTERDLKALQQQLKDALARNAPPEEIKRLTDALRAQLDKLLSEMAQNADRSPEGDRRADQNARTVTKGELQSMLDRMEQAARNGDVAEAQRMLDQLRGILDNLKTAKRRSGRQNQAARDMNRSMGDLDKMMRDQQALRDQTFEDGRKTARNPDGTESGDPQSGLDQGTDPGDQGQQGDAETGQLQSRQDALRRKLEQLQRQMRDQGLEGEKGFDAAQQAMKEAEEALGQGQDGNDAAVEAQGRALRGLQQGAQGLAKQMAQGQGQGEGQEQGQEDGEGQDDGIGDRTGMQTDPLGRPRQTHGTSGRDLELGGGLAARAQQVLEELRRRLADPARPQVEQDYLERLLRRY